MGSGYKPFTAASVLTSADMNNYLMEQSVMFFATTAARDAAITAPEDGMVAYIGSNDANCTPWTQFLRAISQHQRQFPTSPGLSLW